MKCPKCKTHKVTSIPTEDGNRIYACENMNCDYEKGVPEQPVFGTKYTSPAEREIDQSY